MCSQVVVTHLLSRSASLPSSSCALVQQQQTTKGQKQIDSYAISSPVWICENNCRVRVAIQLVQNFLSIYPSIHSSMHLAHHQYCVATNTIALSQQSLNQQPVSQSVNQPASQPASQQELWTDGTISEDNSISRATCWQPVI